MTKQRRSFFAEFKREAAGLVLDQGYSHIEASRLDRHLYKARNLVECFFHKLKQFRRIATRRRKAVALERLQCFAAEQLDDYDRQRDFPIQPGTSQLSAYLAAGVISPRECLHAARRSNQGEFETGNAGAVTWINELLWREFYKHIQAGYPQSAGSGASRDIRP